MPLWLGAGLADWYLHRRTRIEDTAGPKESALHSLMFTKPGFPSCTGFLRGQRRGTRHGDRRGSRAQRHRLLGPGLRRAAAPGHAGRAARPQPAGSLTHHGDIPDHRPALGPGQGTRWPRQAAAPIRAPAQAPRSLSTSTRVILLAAVTAFGVLPYTEELLRCWRANPRLSPLPAPAEPATQTLRIPEKGPVSGPRHGRLPERRPAGTSLPPTGLPLAAPPGSRVAARQGGQPAWSSSAGQLFYLHRQLPAPRT